MYRQIHIYKIVCTDTYIGQIIHTHTHTHITSVYVYTLCAINNTVTTTLTQTYPLFTVCLHFHVTRLTFRPNLAEVSLAI